MFYFHDLLPPPPPWFSECLHISLCFSSFMLDITRWLSNPQLPLLFHLFSVVYARHLLKWLDSPRLSVIFKSRRIAEPLIGSSVRVGGASSMLSMLTGWSGWAASLGNFQRIVSIFSVLPLGWSEFMETISWRGWRPCFLHSGFWEAEWAVAAHLICICSRGPVFRGQWPCSSAVLV